MAVTAAAVKALREKTDLPMMDCKRALVEADGDEARAIEILKQAFKKIQLKRGENATEEGRIFIKVADDGSEAVIVEVQCESAPVGAGEDMAGFGEQLVTQLLTGPGAATADELLGQDAPGGGTLKSLYEEMVNKIREKIVVNRVARVSGPVGTYVHHDLKTGVLFQGKGEGSQPEVLRDVAMHIAALQPTVSSPDELDAAAIQEERERLSAEAKATGKPDNIIDKIVDGRMKQYYVEQGVLAMQPFAKDDSKTVSQALAEAGYEVGNFTRWTIGGA